MLLGSFVASLVSDSDYKRCPSSRCSFVSLDSLASLLNAPAFSDSELKNGRYDIERMCMRSRSKSTLKATGKMQASHSAPSASPAPPLSPSRAQSLTNALHNVARLPRKASRLVCVGDPSHCGTKKDSNGRESGRTEEAERAGLVWRSGSETSGSAPRSASASTGYNTSSNATSYTPHSSSSSVSNHHSQKQSQTKTWTPGPILSPDELAHALARHSLVSPPAVPNATSSPQAPRISNPNSTSEAESNPSNPKSKNPHNLQLPTLGHASGGNIAYPIMEDADSNTIPRPLSPPPDHFRRRERVLSASGLPGPYTSPLQSPTASPWLPNQIPLNCGGQGGQEGQADAGHPILLHDLISSESLVAPPLKLYNGAMDPTSNQSSHQRPRTDFHMGRDSNCTTFKNLEKHLGAPTSAFVNGRGEQRGMQSFRDDLHSHSRSHSRVTEDIPDTQALRRVLSR